MENNSENQIESIPIRGDVKLTFKNIHTGEEEILEYRNVICNVGIYSMIKRMVGVNTNNQGEISYCAVGTDTTTPTASDTQLGTEYFRKPVSTRDYSTNQATYRTFFTTAEANTTLKEIGLFGEDASGSVNSGVLFAKRAINRAKTSSETLTIDWVITLG